VSQGYRLFAVYSPCRRGAPARRDLRVAAWRTVRWAFLAQVTMLEGLGGRAARGDRTDAGARRRACRARRAGPAGRRPGGSAGL